MVVGAVVEGVAAPVVVRAVVVVVVLGGGAVVVAISVVVGAPAGDVEEDTDGAVVETGAVVEVTAEVGTAEVGTAAVVVVWAAADGSLGCASVGAATLIVSSVSPNNCENNAAPITTMPVTKAVPIAVRRADGLGEGSGSKVMRTR